MTVARLTDTDLTNAADGKELGLSADEYARAEKILGRTPNKVELGCFSAMWSEHCSYKSSRVHLRRLPTTGPRVLVGPGENAGVVDVGDGLAVCFKVESHNHPSYIEPYQGAATGVGGILRDVFTMGARPIAAMNLLRFGRAGHAKTAHLLSGVVGGIAGYGNCFGVPTVYSDVDFDESYDGNILVNAFALGVLPADGIFKGTASGVGNPVLYVGAKTGRDGIHGATMASDSFSAAKETKRPTVQVGDPFKEKLLMEACMECFVSGALVGIQDMGAAGLTSSSFEMASRAGSGLDLFLDQVPARERAMQAYELMLSESQERMLLVAEKGKEDVVRRIFAKWDLDAVEVGVVTATGRVRIFKDGALVGDLPASELADEAPRYERPHARAAEHDAAILFDDAGFRRQPADVHARALLASPTFASKWWVYRRYDREVGAATLVDGTRGAAALVQLPGSKKGVALALVCDQRKCFLDPKEGARRTVVEGVLRTAAMGAVAIGASDCLNYGDPTRPAIMQQIVDGIDGIAEACIALDLPVVSGNVSLYNQTDAAAVHPTPAVAIVGLVEDAPAIALAPAARAGDLLVLVGKPPSLLAGSTALALFAGRPAGPLPLIDLVAAKALAGLLRDARIAGVAKDARPVVEGGVIAAAFELAVAAGTGLVVELPAGQDVHDALFGEDTACALVVTAPERLGALQRLCAQHGAAALPTHAWGALGADRLLVRQGDRRVVDEDMATLLQTSAAVVPAIAAAQVAS